ncbi:MAG: glycosyltransferase family 2 protein [Verrucomicrobiaceae bacterium]|nr:glycosyltransferase family 2 protein [Verrucomicrobiaceae bacterium]
MKLLLLIPSYNTGSELLERTVRGALAQWLDVWVVIDGSTDSSDKAVQAMLAEHSGLRLIHLPVNQGKGAAVLQGAQEAQRAGYTHILAMDADGQHPAERIPQFIALSEKYPEAMLLGCPQFGPEAPQVRVQGRKISNAWSNLETLGWGIGDSLFGMRVYPVAALLKAFASTRFARRFDFDTEMAVRIAWQGVPIINVPTPVKYLSREEGGVSQFRYLRDNTLLTWMHARLLFGFLIRLPLLTWRLLRGGNPLRGAT